MSAPIKVSHILVKEKYEAEDLQRRLERGEKFEDLARKFSTCPSAADGGRLGTVDPKRFVEEFRDVLEGMKPDAISGIVRTRFGHHLIRRES